MKGVAWNVRVDSSVEPVLIVNAEGWYEARALAAAQLNVDPKRIHVSQRTYSYIDPRTGQERGSNQ
jgi:hypothetical protein